MSELDALVRARRKGNKSLSGVPKRTMLEAMVEILGYCSEPIAKYKLYHHVPASPVLLEKYLKSLLKASLLTMSEGGIFCINEKGRAFYNLLTQ